MSDTAYFFNLPALIAALDKDVKAHLDFLSLDPNSHHVAQQFLASDLQSVRWNLLSDMLAISDLWAPIRDHITLTDLVLDLTTTLRMEVESLHPGGWASLRELVVSAWACFNEAEATDPAVSVMENDKELARYATTAWVEEALKSNPWLVTLFLLRRTDTVRRLLKELSDVKSRTPPAGNAEEGKN